MDSNQQHEAWIKARWTSFSLMAQKQGHDWFTWLQNGVLLVGWVVLGLGLIALLVTVLGRFPGQFGPILFGSKQDVIIMARSSSVQTLPPPVQTKFFISDASSLLSIIIPVGGAILLYLVLTIVQPKLFPWPQQRIAYLLAIGALLIVVGYILLPKFLPDSTNQFQFCIIAYAIAAHARVTFSKKAGWLVEAIVLVAALISITATGVQYQAAHVGVSYSSGGTAALSKTFTAYKQVTLPVDDQWLLRIPMLGIQIGGTIQLLQAGLWLLGLICLHIFTGIGMHERNARRNSDALVNELTQAQEQLRTYALHAEELATMRERARVAREMHDTLAQGLAAIKMHLETGTKLFDGSPDLTLQHIERARELAGEYLNETRNSILNLRADALDGRTLPSALAMLANTWPPEHHEGNATFCVSGIAEDASFWQTLAPALELACYRIAQEALSNASRHGHAQHVDIELSIENHELCLTITDDGVGFDPTTIRSCRKGGGFGIIGMHERLKLLKGRLELLSAPEAGTQVVAMIPLTGNDLTQASSNSVKGQKRDPYLAGR
ncbi:MAG TPA: sensor histidine kinase [Ktedonobacteraceae bacterium]|nr:sensor histidine kinase [Ktedonobacteraceae bacterium]